MANMPINHLAPPTGQMADNVIGFARALRAAGLPVGPGAVLDALQAVEAACSFREFGFWVIF